MTASGATAFDTAVLAAALALPLMGLVPALLVLDLRYVGRWSRLGALGAAVAWAVVLVRSRHPELGLFQPDDLAATGSAGAALLAAAQRRPPLGVGVALTAVTAGLAAVDSSGGVERPAAAGAGVGLALACALTGANRPLHPWSLAAGGLGGAAVVAGLAGVADRSGWAAPAGPLLATGGTETFADPSTVAGVVLAVGCAGLAVAAASRPSRPLVIVVPAVLVVAVRGLPWLGDRGAGPAAAVALAAAATVVAVGWRGAAPAPAAAVAAWAVVAAMAPVPGVAPAAGLVAAGAVLGSVAAGPVAVGLAALPGLVAVVHGLTEALADDPGWEAASLLVLVLGTAAALVPPTLPGRPRDRAIGGVAEVAALALLAWLVLTPGAWHWLGPPALDAYEEGAALAVAVGSVVVAGTLALVGRRGPAALRGAVSQLADAAAVGALWPAHDPDAAARRGVPVADPEVPVSPVAGLVALVARPHDHSQWAVGACIVALAALGIATAVLVGSTVS